MRVSETATLNALTTKPTLQVSDKNSKDDSDKCYFTDKKTILFSKEIYVYLAFTLWNSKFEGKISWLPTINILQQIYTHRHVLVYNISYISIFLYDSFLWATATILISFFSKKNTLLLEAGFSQKRISYNMGGWYY